MEAPLRSALNADVEPARSGEFEPLSLGSLEVWPPVVLAPMAGVTNAAFRRLCREFGAGLYVSEMITARGLIEGHRRTRRLASFGEDETIRSLQLYGSDPVSLREATKLLVAENAVDHLDMNFGCPVRKVTSHGGGAAIPIKPRLLARLVRSVVEAAGEIPVTIKVRLGVDADLLSFRSSGRVAQEEGCRAIGLHARTAAQLYDGDADWSRIGELVQELSIPVLGNGDIWECWDALRMMRQTGCAGVIVGRGCLGRPWLFRELAAVFDGEMPRNPPRLGEVLDVLRRHADYLLELFGPRQGILELRKWCGWYLRGFAGGAKIRGELYRVDSLEDLESKLVGLDREAEFPRDALRVRRCKRAGTQKVSLPAGYLDDLEDDHPPKMPRDPVEAARWEQMLSGG